MRLRPAGVPPTGLALGFSLGVCLLQWVPRLPPASLLLAALGAVLVLQRWSRFAVWCAPLLLGVSWAWLHAHSALQERIDPAVEGVDLAVVGTVDGLPDLSGPAARFVLRVESASLARRPVPMRGRVRLSWYRSEAALRAGERWRLRVRLKAPHGFANPGSFDYEAWLFAQGIQATGYVRADPGNRRLTPAGLGLDGLRQTLADRVRSLVTDEGARGLILALTLGDRSAIEPDRWEVLTRTGTNHLVAISGLHVGIAAGLVFFLIQSVWRRSAGLCGLLAAQRAGAGAALAAGIVYAGLAGFAVSTQRAIIMLAVVSLGLLWRRTLRPASGLSTALAGILLLDPMACLSPGFWLSFGAVTVLLYGMTRRLGQSGLWWRWGRAQWLVAVGLLPLLLLFFARASLVAPLANLVAVPIFSLVLLPVLLAAVAMALILGWVWPLAQAAWLLEQCYGALAWLGGQPWAAWSFPGPPVWTWPLGFLGVALLLSPRGLPGRWLGTVLLGPLFLMRPPEPEPGEFKLAVLDVGQGLAAVVQTRGHVLVYDTGPRFPGGLDTGKAVVAPFLRSAGIERVDRLLVSHADIDHAGGLRGLLAEMPVDRILSGEPGKLDVDGVMPCRSGMEWAWDGVDFRILHPAPPLPVSGNDRSCVLRVENRAGSVLLTGDAEKGVEQALVTRSFGDLRARVLVAGHHGSATSTSAGFLAAVTPEFVVFSAGYRNRYGFPRTEVVARARVAGARILDTIRSGALQVDFRPGEGRLRWQGHRQAARRYWTHGAEF